MKNAYLSLLGIIIISFISIGSLFGQSQEPNMVNQKTAFKNRINFEVKLMDESLGYPASGISLYAFNPAVSIGAEYILKEKRNHDFHLAADLMYYYHKQWQTAVNLHIAFGYRYRLKRFSIFPRLGAGYSHSFYVTPIYKYQDGHYKKISDYGNPTFVPFFSLNIGYQIVQSPRSHELFLTMMQNIEIPFTEFWGAHQFIGVGYRFSLTKTK
jgi:hypothetical protein